ncbi:MAG: DNA mismatch repair protein MutS [Candidatus Desulforudis sp.]|nr:DNA mismatch repair protein MutS [Desulforudis sp.]MBV1735948.1 DNA mismatch repair protein MutS [Desulforudis sp.]
MSLTPMMRQYFEIKKDYPDAILFFRMGDFYEMFHDDAVLAAPILEITLTSRDAGRAGRIPMCGLPHHAGDGYLAKLVEQGYKVAVCDQVEDPKAAKGIVRRAVTRVVTPGTIMEGPGTDVRRNSYLVAVCRDVGGYGMCAADIGTGDIMTTAFTGEWAQAALRDELGRLEPSEILVPAAVSEEAEILSASRTWETSVTTITDIEPGTVEDVLVAHFGRDVVENEAWARHHLTARAVGALIGYLKETQKRELVHLREVRSYAPGRYMFLDPATRRNLEISRSIRDGSRRGTLLATLDGTVTAMGSRLLRHWLEQPLLGASEVSARLDGVDELYLNTFLREDLRARLKRVYDIERLCSRVAYGSANARDLLALRDSLKELPAIKILVGGCSATLLGELNRNIDPLDDVCELLARAIAEEPPVSVRDGGIIRTGFDSEVDRLRAVGSQAKNWLCELEVAERERTGVRSLKIGFNRVFGYYIEITRANQHLVPEDYERRQTLANAERFVTPRLKEYESQIMGAEESLIELEYRLFQEVRETAMAQLGRMQMSAQAVAAFDAISALATVAVRENYCRPTVNNSDRIVITNGRHPVVETALGPGEFVPNDTELNGSDQRLVLLTGPNMAGKSTYMRQVALITLMAQMGSFVPADAAEIGVVDRIFTRVGASDDLVGGESTFMVEMNECRVIIEHATPASLIVMDEVGRGTSTYDGMSLARALIEFIHSKIGAKTLFSTHYHELTDLDQQAGIVNYTITVAEKGDEVVFLRRVVPGKADRSYGIQVARLAGLPESLIKRAFDILRELEAGTGSGLKTGRNSTLRQMELFETAAERKLLRELAGMDLMEMTPLEALNKLYAMQRDVQGVGKRVVSGGK